MKDKIKMSKDKKTEIRIYTKLKSDMEFIIKQIENHNVDIIRMYISGIEAVIKQIEKEQEKENNNGKKANK